MSFVPNQDSPGKTSEFSVVWVHVSSDSRKNIDLFSSTWYQSGQLHFLYFRREYTVKRKDMLVRPPDVFRSLCLFSESNRKNSKCMRTLEHQCEVRHLQTSHSNSIACSQMISCDKAPNQSIRRPCLVSALNLSNEWQLGKAFETDQKTTWSMQISKMLGQTVMSKPRHGNLTWVLQLISITLKSGSGPWHRPDAQKEPLKKRLRYPKQSL